MTKETTSTIKRKRRSPLGKRQLSATVSSTRLWIPDKQLLKEIARKRHLTDADLIREIVHNWAIKKRLAPDTDDGAEETALIELQRETKTAVEGLIALLNRLVDATSSYGDLLTLNEAQLSHLISVSNGHYSVTAQTFAALWFVVQLLQQLHLIPLLQANTSPPAVDKEIYDRAVTITDAARMKGLQMVEQLIKACQSPQPVVSRLISPTDPQ